MIGDGRKGMEMERVLYILKNDEYKISDVAKIRETLSSIACPLTVRVDKTHVEVVVFCSDSEGLREKVSSLLKKPIIKVYIGEPEVIDGKELETYLRFMEEGLYWLAHTFMEKPWKKFNSEAFHSLVLYAAAFAKAQENERDASLSVLKMALEKFPKAFDFSCAVDEIKKVLNNMESHPIRCLNLKEFGGEFRHGG